MKIIIRLDHKNKNRRKIEQIPEKNKNNKKFNQVYTQTNI